MKKAASKGNTRPRSSDKLKTLKGKGNEVFAGASQTVADLECEQGSAEVDTKTECREEVYALRIDTEKFSTLTPKPPDKPKSKILVRKNIPKAESKSSGPKARVLVAKPAQQTDVPAVSSSHADIKPDLGAPGDNDVVKTHHILGTAKDMWTEANLRGESGKYMIPMGSYNILSETAVNNNLEIDNGDSHKSNDSAHIDEGHALSNWDKHMNERKKQQEHLANTMKVPIDMLVMNQGEQFRTVQEERTVIDRAMPSMNYGKGYRVGSEFWKQVENFGPGREEEGLSITLTQTERGFAPPVEHIGYANFIKHEMGVPWNKTRRTKDVHYPWDKSFYREERYKQLGRIISELDPHDPYMDGLEVIGKKIEPNLSNQYEFCAPVHRDLTPILDDSQEEDLVLDEEKENDDPLAMFIDVVPEHTFGPSLLINGQSASWKGENHCPGTEEAGLTVRLMFDAEVEDFAKSSVNITNDGTAAIFYHWEKKPQLNPFGIHKGRPLQRFYFDSSDGRIMPGQTIELPILFKSVNSGLFNEVWQLETHPVLLGGSNIELVLRGMASKQDDFVEDRKKLEEDLKYRQRDRIVERIIDEVIAGIGTPPRPGTPDDKYITEEEIFKRQNDQMHYKTDTIDSLKSMYRQLDEECGWNLSVDSLLKIITMENDDEAKEEMLENLNNDVQRLVNQAPSPLPKSAYNTCYQILCETVDAFVNESSKLRLLLGLPEKTFVLKIEEQVKKSKKGQSTHNELPANKSRQEARKDLKKESPSGRAAKVSQPSKGKPIKDKEKTENISLARMDTTVDIGYKEISETPDLNDPVYSKYLNQFHMAVHSSLVDMADKVAAVLSSPSDCI